MSADSRILKILRDLRSSGYTWEEIRQAVSKVESEEHFEETAETQPLQLPFDFTENED